jgi:hypothetical protein
VIGSNGDVEFDVQDGFTMDPLASIDSSTKVTLNTDFLQIASHTGPGSRVSIAGRIVAPIEDINQDYLGDVPLFDIISLTNVQPGTAATITMKPAPIGAPPYVGNRINLGSLNPLDNGKLSAIAGSITVQGSGPDLLYLDDSGDTTTWTGSQEPTITATNVTGLGMGTPTGVAYAGLGLVELWLGHAAQTINVLSTAANPLARFGGTHTVIGTLVAGNTWNVGSQAPTTAGGVLAGIQGPLEVRGGGAHTSLADTLNVDDSGSTGSESGTLTDSTLTGLRMGPMGIFFQGMAVLNLNLGQGPVNLQGNITNDLPATTTITGGSSNVDRFDSNWANDFNGTLNLIHLGGIDLDVAGEFYGHLNAASPSRIESLTVGGSVNVGSSISDLTDPAISAQQIDHLDIGKNLDINLNVPGPVTPAGARGIGNATIGGTLPQGITVAALSIGALVVGNNSTLPAGSNNLAGDVVTTGNMGTLEVVLGSITTTSTVTVGGDLNTLKVGPGQLSVGQNMAGFIDVTGTLGFGRIAGGTPGLFEAGHVGTIGAYGGFGPVVMHVIEAGVDRRVEEADPGQFYLQPNANNVAGSPYVNIQYLYESAGFSSPQLSARITNNVGTGPEQFDLSTVVLQDGGKFNLARLDAVGVSGLRNLAVEGSLVPGVSGTAAIFFAGDNSPGGVYLPDDSIAGIGIRDYAPKGSILAAEIQGVGFGSFTNGAGQVEPGSQSTAADATALLAAGTNIVPAGSVNGQGTETFRVPFAALPGQKVAFYLDTAPSGAAFDPNDMVFTLQSDSDGVHAPQLFPATRGAVTAMIGVEQQPSGSVVQSVDLYGDGGSIFSEQFIAQSITSTGPLGDLTVLANQGLNNVTAPSIFGNIAAQGPLFGTIQTTGVRTDPVTGATTQVPADLGRAYVVPIGGRNGGAPYVTTTTIEGQGQDSLSPTGRIISRGNLISLVRSDGGAKGLIAVQGDLGAVTTLLRTPKRVGGLLVNGGFDGQLVVLGNDYGDLTFHGGLTGGRIAVQGTGGAPSGILGNVIVDRGLYPTGAIGAGSAIVSGGEIGDASYGTSLTAEDGNQGIVAAIGAINFGNGPLGGSVFNNAGGTPNAAAIDAIFTENGQPLGLDLPGQPFGGLELILQDLADLYVDSSGKLAGPKP